MLFANVLSIVAMLLWAGLLLIGVALVKAPAQFAFYIGIPFAAIVAVGGVALFVNVMKRFWIASYIVSVSVMIAVLPYLVMYGGGV